MYFQLVYKPRLATFSKSCVPLVFVECIAISLKKLPKVLIVCPSANICISRIACVFNARFISEAALIFVIKLSAEIVFVNTSQRLMCQLIFHGTNFQFAFFIVRCIYKIFAVLCTVPCFKHDLTF